MTRIVTVKFIYRLFLAVVAGYGLYQAGAAPEAAARLNPATEVVPAAAAAVGTEERGATLSQAAPYTTTLTFTPTTTYLSNPAIGWQEGKSPDDPILPETVVYKRSDTDERSYSWEARNPEEGVYDWSIIDADLAEATAQGKQFSFRIFTTRGESFDSFQIPLWVRQKGAVVIPSGKPDYSNCVYQEEWAEFVEAMRQKYDGNPDIAFIDISGYGNFNEWSWDDDQTEWEDNTFDGQARRRLADMFIGGQNNNHECRTINGSKLTVSYNYPGFQETQLLMPYAGIRKSSEYVAGRRPDVGIRHDCLGAGPAEGMKNHIGEVVSKTWPNAPIVYEFCSGSTSDSNYISRAREILRWTHGSMVHDNLNGKRDKKVLRSLLKFAGYRFVLDQVAYPTVIVWDHDFSLEMTWHNTGYAPAYPKMGQDFELHFYLVAADGTVVQDWLLEADIADWLPADPVSAEPPDQRVVQTLRTPADLPLGRYTTMAAIIDKRTGRPINLAFEGQPVDVEGQDESGRYPLGRITVSDTPPPPPTTPLFLPFVVNNSPVK